jgi:hypothetical protein
MASPLWTEFLSRSNFELAVARLIRGGNRDYKSFFRHLFPTYRLAERANLSDLIADIRHHRFQPDLPLRVFQPKASGILRPLTLLSLKDQIVYQAIVNIVARCFATRQRRHAYTRCFGAIFAGQQSLFFYDSWKRSYSTYNSAIARSFHKGCHWVADFDLVSFYDLIDHNLLRTVLSKQIKSFELTELLFECLQSWTPRSMGAHVHHGIPQGPEASAFLAECFLFYLDRGQYPDVTYLRYVDDIKLMGTDEVAVRRSLIRLDLRSKRLGLVPQAQKVTCQEVSTLAEIRKTIPSTLQAQVARHPRRASTTATLVNMFRSSLSKARPPEIENPTRFKYSLTRLPRRRDVLRRIAPLLTSRPDMSGILARYVGRFSNNREAAEILASALERSPVFESTAADFVGALHHCEPTSATRRFRSIVKAASKDSIERTGLLRLACSTFRGARASPSKAKDLVAAESVPLFRSLLLHRLCDDLTGSFQPSVFRAELEAGTISDDPDYARYCASLLAGNGMWPTPIEVRKAARSVRLLGLALGLRKRAPRQNNVLSLFFEKKLYIGIKLSWRKALGSGYRDAEARCIRLQRFELGDPSAYVLILDTFNEALIQALSRKHRGLAAAFKAGAKNGRVLPDFGW